MGKVWGNPYLSHTMGILWEFYPILWEKKYKSKTQTMGKVWENWYFSHSMRKLFPILWEFYGNYIPLWRNSSPFYGNCMGITSHTMVWERFKIFCKNLWKNQGYYKMKSHFIISLEKCVFFNKNWSPQAKEKRIVSRSAVL